MNSLENSIKDCISRELEKGIIEKVIEQKLEECIATSIKDLFGWNGEVKNVIEDKVKSVMIPYLEQYDYSKYITKLDHVLVDVLKSSTLENKVLIENFKELITKDDIPKTIKLSDIYNKWTEYCSKEVDTSNLNEDCGEYQCLEVSLDVEDVSRDWSSFKRNIIAFECEQDEELNIEFELTRWDKSSSKNYDLSYNQTSDIKSLRRLNNFEVYMMKLLQAGVEIEIDTNRESDEIEVEANPYE